MQTDNQGQTKYSEAEFIWRGLLCVGIICIGFALADIFGNIPSAEPNGLKGAITRIVNGLMGPHGMTIVKGVLGYFLVVYSVLLKRALERRRRSYVSQ